MCVARSLQASAGVRFPSGSGSVIAVDSVGAHSACFVWVGRLASSLPGARTVARTRSSSSHVDVRRSRGRVGVSGTFQGTRERTVRGSYAQCAEPLRYWQAAARGTRTLVASWTGH
jgi:hypothetical protein